MEEIPKDIFELQPLYEFRSTNKFTYNTQSIKENIRDRCLKPITIKEILQLDNPVFIFKREFQQVSNAEYNTYLRMSLIKDKIHYPNWYAIDDIVNVRDSDIHIEHDFNTIDNLPTNEIPDSYFDICSIYQVLIKRGCPDSYIRFRLEREFNDNPFKSFQPFYILYVELSLISIEGIYYKDFKYNSQDFASYFHINTNLNKINNWIRKIYPTDLIFTDSPAYELPKGENAITFVLDENNSKYRHGRLFVAFNTDFYNGDKDDGYYIDDGVIEESSFNWDYGSPVPNGRMLGYTAATNSAYLYHYQQYSYSDCKKYVKLWIYDMLEKIEDEDDRKLFIKANILSYYTNKININEISSDLDYLLNIIDNLKE